MSNSNKKYYQTLFLFIALLLAYSLQLNATIRYVSKTGLSIPPYTTPETAADSIQKCINICLFGDTIYVANGIYQEQVVMIDGLSLIGAGTDSCVVDSRIFSPSGNRTITMKDSCLVTGFYIRTSDDFNYGQGVRAEGQGGLVTLNKFSNSNNGIYLYGSNTEAYRNYCFNVRTGIALANSNSIVGRNEIFTLIEPIGSGIYITAFNSNYKPTIDSNYLETRSDGINKSFGARPIIKNNVIVFSPYGSIGMRFSTSDSAFVYNNLIIAKSGIEVGTGIRNYGTQNIIMHNNCIIGKYLSYIILMGPDDQVENNMFLDTEGWISVYSGGNFKYQYNNMWDSNISYSGITPDTTNLSVDPMVVNDDTTQGDLDFHLQKYSPLIDAGDPNILDKDSSRSDIGLYGGPYGESYTYQDLAPKLPKGLFAVVDSSIITLTWNRNTEADFNHYNLYRDTTSNFQIDSTKLVASLTDTFYLHIIPPGVERLYFRLTGVDNQGNESNPSEEVAVILVSVKNEWKPINSYILYQNYPNPFNPSTKIGYKLKERGYVKLYVYDVKGELIEVLVNQTQESGYYEVEFSGEGKTELIGVKNPFVSGVYLCQIIVQSEKGIPVFSDMIKMVLLK